MLGHTCALLLLLPMDREANAKRIRCVSLGRLRTTMGFHKRRQSEGRRTCQGILPGKFTPGYTPVLTTLPERGGTYAEACTIGTGLAGCAGIYVAKKRQFWWQNAPILCLQQDGRTMRSQPVANAGRSQHETLSDRLGPVPSAGRNSP